MLSTTITLYANNKLFDLVNQDLFWKLLKYLKGEKLCNLNASYKRYSVLLYEVEEHIAILDNKLQRYPVADNIMYAFCAVEFILQC